MRVRRPGAARRIFTSLDLPRYDIQTPSPMRRAWLPDAAGVALAIGLALRLANGIDTVRDLPIDDEAAYELRGVALRFAWASGVRAQWPSPDWAPLYSGWYGVWSFVVHDPIRLADVSWTALVVGITVLLYALARRLDQPPHVALVIAAAPLLTSFFHVEPYPGLLSLLILLGAARLALACRGDLERRSVLLGGMAFAGFVRPEVAIGFVVGTFALGVWVTAKWRARTAGVRPVVPALALGSSAILFAVFGNPFGGDRSFFAFSQHYAFEVSRREHLSINPWVRYAEITTRDFGASTSIGAAARANPRGFSRHILHNVGELPGNVLDLCSLRRSITTAASVPWLAASAVIIAVIAIALGVCIARTRRADDARRAVIELFVLVAVAALPGILIVFPRAHHLYALCAIGWLLGASFVADEGRRRLRPRAVPSGLYAMGVAIAVWLLMPTASRSVPGPMPMRKAAEALRVARLQPVRALELGVGYLAFAGHDGPILSGWADNEPLPVLLRDRAVGIVVLGELNLQQRRFASDPDMQAFLGSPQEYGFCELYRDPGFVRVLTLPAAVGEPDRRLACEQAVMRK